MPLATKLDRSIRPAEDSSDGESYYEVSDRSSESVIDTAGDGDILSSEDDQDDEDNEEPLQAQISQVSFGALAKAQDALANDSSDARKRKRGEDTSKSHDDKLEALRARLREIKAEKLANGVQSSKSVRADREKEGKPAKRRRDKEDNEKEDDDDDDDEESDASDSDAAPKSRSSKHAPKVQSSKRMVSRKRAVIDVKKPVFRDPRFDNMGGAKPDENTMDNRYSFLKDYRNSEIADLKATIRKTKNEGEKERLKKQLISMESQKKTRENKEKQQEIVREHKKKEKELIKQGKQPFYLKKCKLKSRRARIVDTRTTYLLRCSGAKEDGAHRTLPKYEGETARQGHRTTTKEGHVQRATQHAIRATRRIISLLRLPFAMTAHASLYVFHVAIPGRQQHCACAQMSRRKALQLTSIPFQN